MDREQMIANVRIMTETNDEENTLVAFYLDNAKEVIFHQMYPYCTDGEEMKFKIPNRYQMLQCRIAAHFINKRGAEGELHHSENGILRIYGSEDVPESMLREIVPKAVVL